MNTGGGAVMIGRSYEQYSDPARICLTNGDTLYITAGSSLPNGIDAVLADLKVRNFTAAGTMYVTGNQEIHWDTYASSDWTNLGGFWFHNTYNGKSMEFKAIAHEYYSTLYPVMQMLYYDYNGADPVTIFQFDMNGTFEYAGYLVEMDYMNDIAALRAIKTKTHENGMTIYDPDSLKFLQGQEGRYSLNACIGWELSVQRKFLQEIDNLKLQIADLHSQLNTLKEDNPNNTVN